MSGDLIWINYFPWFIMWSLCIIIILYKHRPKQPLMPLHHCLMCAGQSLHCGTDTWQRQNEWWVNLVHREMKCLIDILADKHISQKLDTGKLWRWAMSAEWMKERSYECFVYQCRPKTAIHKGTKLYFPYWHKIFWWLLPGRTYQSYLSRLLCWLCSHCEMNRSRLWMGSRWDHLM